MSSSAGHRGTALPPKIDPRPYRAWRDPRADHKAGVVRVEVCPAICFSRVYRLEEGDPRPSEKTYLPCVSTCSAASITGTVPPLPLYKQ